MSKYDGDLELMTQIARLYYLHDNTQAAIADQLHISRSKASRLLKKAREEGIIQIGIQAHPRLIVRMGDELRKRFGLKQVLISDDQLDSDSQRAAVARTVSDYLIRNLRDGMVVSAGLGRNTGAVPENILGMPPQCDCTFVPAMGGSPRNELINPDHTCRRLAERFGARSESLYAPAYVQSLTVRNSFLSHDAIQRTLDLARRSDIVLVGVGDVADDATVVSYGCFSAAEMAELRQAGAVGDILGYFYDKDGQPVSVTGIQDRVIGLSVDDLRRVPVVIAIASETNKGLSILGALRTGVVSILATSASNVRDVLTLDSETRSE